MNRYSRALSIAALVALLGCLAGCGGGRRVGSSGDLTGGLTVVLKAKGILIYDPTGHSSLDITNADVVRSAVQIERIAGSVNVNVGLTNRGATKLCELTRTLARLGARLHKPQRFNIAVDGRIYSRPRIDYRTSPNGLCGSPDVEFAALSPHTAQVLAHEIRTG